MELEEETTERIFRHLWRLTKGARIRKLRFRVAEGDLTWEIDRFRGRRLVLAEVELPSEDADAPIPAWLAPCVEREVTGEKEYVNINLAG
jgi:CYTH domain-containing protein